MAKGEKILVMEGDKAFAESLSKALGEQGYTVITAGNGTDGLKALVDNLPHLVILDVVLPAMDGYDVLEKKQAEPLLQKIPVFLISTQGVPVNMRRVPQGSVKEYILMFQSDSSQLVKLVNHHFGHEEDAKPPVSADGKKTLVWVEDDKLIGTILEKKFIQSGFNLLHAKNGEEALSILDGVVPNAIVLDLLLPGMNGFDILQKIRASDKHKNVPVMILSNLSKPSDLERAKLLGAKKFLIKAATSLDQIVSEVQSICT